MAGHARSRSRCLGGLLLAGAALAAACGQPTILSPAATPGAGRQRASGGRPAAAAASCAPGEWRWKLQLVQPEQLAALRAAARAELPRSPQPAAALWRVVELESADPEHDGPGPIAIDHRPNASAAYVRSAPSDEPLGGGVLHTGPAGSILVLGGGLHRFMPESERLQRLSSSILGSDVYALDERTFMIVGAGGTELWDLPSARRLGRARHGEQPQGKLWRIDDDRVLVEVTAGPYSTPAAELWSRDCGKLPPPTWRRPYYLDRGSEVGGVALGDGSLLTLTGFWLASDGRRSELFDPPPRAAIVDRREGSALVTLEAHRALQVGGVLLDPDVPDTLTGVRLARALMAPALELEVPPLSERPVPQLKHPRFGHTATALADGSALIAGGASYLAPVLELERWDASARAFRNAGRLRRARIGHSATLLADGGVLLAGGCALDVAATGDLKGVRVAARDAERSAEIWHPERRGSADAGRLQTPRCGHTALRLADGRVLVIGGYEHPEAIGSGGGAPSGEGFLSSCELFDPRSGSWSKGPDMRRGRAQASAVLLPDGRVLVVGTEPSSDGVPRTAELLDADLKAWHTAHELPPTAGDEQLLATGDGHVLLLSYGDVLDVGPP